MVAPILPLILGLLVVVASGCTRNAPDTATAERRRRTVVSHAAIERAGTSGGPTVFAPAHRIVRELDPPLSGGEPEECAVADEFRPALGCLESLPLGPDTVASRPGNGRLSVEGSVPRKFWDQPMLIEPRVRGEPLAGFKRASAEIVNSGFFGFAFTSTLPPLDGEGDLELQLRAYAVPPAHRDFVSLPISFGTDDFLAVGLALHPVGLPFATGPVTFQVFALTDHGQRELFTERIDPADWSGDWLDRRIELSDLAGQTGRLRFQTKVDARADEVSRGFPLWGSPEIFQRTPRGPRRNLIVISLDTWRGDHFDTDVSGGPVTPRLAELATRGAVFEQAIATYPSTSASHMSLFTGLYPITHQVRFANDVLGSTIPTLAEMLAADGYQTGAVTENAMLLAETGFAFGFDSYFENKGLGIWNTDGQIDSTLARGRAWLRQHDGERFFLFLHTYQVHTPYEPPAEYVFGPSDDELGAATEPKWVTTLRHRYAGEVRYSDVALAAFLRDLDEAGLLDESIVVLTSDHGEEFFEHDEVGHSKSVYDEVLRVPLLIWAPGLVHPGVRVSSMVSLVDVVPTVLDLLRIPPPKNLQGTSLRAALEGASLPAHEPRFAEGPDTSRPGERLVAVRTEAHKWIAPEGTSIPTEIYDLDADPNEQENLDDDTLREIGRRHLESYAGLAAGTPLKRDLDARTTEKLRALGYVE